MNMDPRIEIGNEKQIERQKLEEEFEKNAAVIMQHQKLQIIDSFTAYFDFLHNNFMTPVYYEGVLYPSVTHGFQASRSNDENTRRAILNAENLTIVGKIARRIEDPENWELKRLKIMEQLIRDKFRRSKELRDKLKSTGNRELVMSYEEETHGNLFWGKVKGKGKGQNQLGRLLMKIREDLTDQNMLLNREITNWISTNYELVTDKSLLPELSLTVNKNCTTIDHILLKNKPFYKFGQLTDSDVLLAHPSISRLHAVIICDKNLGVVLVDLKSKAGTKLDDDIIHDNIPYRLKSGKKLNFALSTRDYIINIDTTKIKKAYEKEKNKLEDEMELINELNNINNVKSTQNENIIKKTFGIVGNDDNDNIFVNHLPQDAIIDDLKKLFEENFGKIKNFRCPVDKETGKIKGFCFIQFESKESAKEAVEYSLIGYRGDVFLKIKYADPKPIWNNYKEKESNKPRHKENDNKKKEEDKRTKEEYKKHMKNDLEKITRKRISRKESSSSSSSESSSHSDSSQSSSNSDSNDSDSDSRSRSSSSSFNSSSTEKIIPKKKHKIINKKRNRSNKDDDSKNKKRRK